MAFVKFTRTRARIGTPRVSVWSRGQIGFNQGAVDEFGINKFQYAVLYYDDETNRIGIEFTTDGDAKGACKLAFRKNSGVSISAVAFLKIFKIDYSKTRKFDLRHDDESGYYIVDLNNPLE